MNNAYPVPNIDEYLSMRLTPVEGAIRHINCLCRVVTDVRHWRFLVRNNHRGTEYERRSPCELSRLSTGSVFSLLLDCPNTTSRLPRDVDQARLSRHLGLSCLLLHRIDLRVSDQLPQGIGAEPGMSIALPKVDIRSVIPPLTQRATTHLARRSKYESGHVRTLNKRGRTRLGFF